jgi:macrolide-specific efflux system membrane fusion protein
MSGEQTESSATSASAGGRKRGRSLAVLVLLAAVLAGGYYWYRTTSEAEGERPFVAVVTLGDIESAVASSGTLQPSNTVPVGAQVSGQLQKLHVVVGDQVETGVLLGEIDARVQRNKVESSRASIASAEAQIAARKEALVLAQANWERQQRLWEEQATSKQEYDNARNNLAAAQASLTQQEQSIIQSKATLATDETQLEFTQIFAPIAGTVVSIAMREGTTLNATQTSPTILSIADLKTMTVETQISEADIGKVYPGMPVYFTTLGSGTRRWYSTLRQILPTPTATNNVVTYTGLFDIDNADGALLSGMTTQVYFVTSSARNVLTVPIGALTFVDAAPPAERAPRGAGPPRAGAAGGGSGAPPSGDVPGGLDARRRGGAGPAAGRAVPPRLAKVRVVAADGTISEREVTIGVTSRVSAEVISGLQEGEQVVAGIAQPGAPAGAGTNGGNNNNRGNFPGGGFPGGGFPGGGFPGGFPGGR